MFRLFGFMKCHLLTALIPFKKAKGSADVLVCTNLIILNSSSSCVNYSLTSVLSLHLKCCYLIRFVVLFKLYINIFNYIKNVIY